MEGDGPVLFGELPESRRTAFPLYFGPTKTFAAGLCVGQIGKNRFFSERLNYLSTNPVTFVCGSIAVWFSSAPALMIRSERNSLR